MYVDVALLLLRVVIGGVVIPHGLLKFGVVGKGGSIPGVAGWFNSMGLRPGIFWAYVAALAEAGEIRRRQVRIHFDTKRTCIAAAQL